MIRKIDTPAIMYAIPTILGGIERKCISENPNPSEKQIR